MDDHDEPGISDHGDDAPVTTRTSAKMAHPARPADSKLPRALALAPDVTLAVATCGDLVSTIDARMRQLEHERDEAIKTRDEVMQRLAVEKLGLASKEQQDKDLAEERLRAQREAPLPAGILGVVSC